MFMTKVEIKMSIRLFVSVILWHNFFLSNTHAQNPLISKSINITTIVGETIEFNCLEFMESKEFTHPDFEWFKNGVPFRVEKYYKRVSLNKFGEILEITNVEAEDEGTYECALSYQFQCAYSMFTLTIENLSNVKIHKLITSNEIRHIGSSTIWYCFELRGTEYNIDKYTWYKNGKPLRVNDSDDRILLEYENQKLTYRNLRYEDSGSYECLASNKFRIDSSVYTLNVVESSKNMHYNYYQANLMRHIGDTVQWSCYLSLIRANENNLHYTWLKNDEPLRIPKTDTHITLSEDNDSLRINVVTFDDIGNYSCVAINGSITSYMKTNLIVVDRPKKCIYKWYTSNIRLLIGAKLQLNCITLRSTKYYSTLFTWKKNGQPLVLADGNKNVNLKNMNTTLELLDITPYEKGMYECEAENDYHKIYSVYTINVVEPQAPVIYNSSEPTTSVNLNESAQLFCYVHGIPPPKILWFKNGDLFDVSKNNGRVLLQDYKQKLLFLFTILEDNGTYGCIVTNNMGSKVSNYKFSIKTINVQTTNSSRQHPSINIPSTSSGYRLPIAYMKSSTSNPLHRIKISKKDTTNVINEKQNEHTYSIWNILIFSTVLLIGGILVICFVMSFKREKTLRKELKDHKLKFFKGDLEKWNVDLGIEEQTDLLPYDKQWEFPKNKLKLEKQLGSGAFGVVYKANAIGINGKSTSTTVAVKMVKPNSDSCHTRALISELKIMIHIGKHLNIVNILGACTENITNNLMVIIEYCRFGNVREYLLKQRDGYINQFTSDGSLNQNDPNNISSYDHSNDSSLLNDFSDYQLIDEDEPAWCSNYHGDYSDVNIPPLCTQDLLSWSFQIARGMAYLSSKKVLHGDLAIRNILLADKNVVKICDFGLAKTIHNYDSYKMSKKVPLPVKWMALESLRDQVISTQSDVWSFGIVLWELFSLAETPYPDVKSFNDLYDRLISGYRMNQPKYANHQLYGIMYDCWKMNPNSRPSFTDLTERIDNLLQEFSKSYYVNLNKQYTRMNTKTSLSTGYVNLMSTPNCSTEYDTNYYLSSENLNRTESNDGLEINVLVNNQSYS